MEEGKGNKQREGEYFYNTMWLGEDGAEDPGKSLKYQFAKKILDLGGTLLKLGLMHSMLR